MPGHGCIDFIIGPIVVDDKMEFGNSGGDRVPETGPLAYCGRVVKWILPACNIYLQR